MSELEQAEPKRRGRPARQQAADDVIQTAEHAAAHVAIQQQRQYLDSKGDKVEEWYILRGNKLLKRARYKNNNIYTHYVDALKPYTKDPARKERNKELQAFIDKIRAEGKLRA